MAYEYPINSTCTKVDIKNDDKKCNIEMEFENGIKIKMNAEYGSCCEKISIYTKNMYPFKNLYEKLTIKSDAIDNCSSLKICLHKRYWPLIINLINTESFGDDLDVESRYPIKLDVIIEDMTVFTTVF